MVYQCSCQVLHGRTQLTLLLLLLLLSRFSRVRLCATPETVAHQAPPSLGFSRQEPYAAKNLWFLCQILFVH